MTLLEMIRLPVVEWTKGDMKLDSRRMPNSAYYMIVPGNDWNNLHRGLEGLVSLESLINEGWGLK